MNLYVDDEGYVCFMDGKSSGHSIVMGGRLLCLENYLHSMGQEITLFLQMTN